jgi:Tol biopolymer transport system component
MKYLLVIICLLLSFPTSITHAQDLMPQIIYSTIEDSFSISAMNIDGSNQRLLLAIEPLNNAENLFFAKVKTSLNGRTLLIVTSASNGRSENLEFVGYQVFLIDLTTDVVIYLNDVALGDATYGELMAENDVADSIDVSPDGTLIAFAARPSMNEYQTRVAIARADGSDPTFLVHNDGTQDEEVAWSPDGKRVVFSSIDYAFNVTDIQTGIYMMMVDPDGTITSGRQAVSGVTSGAVYRDATWSANGLFVAFTSPVLQGKPTAEIYVTNVFAGGLRYFSSGTIGSPYELSWSPDNRYLLVNALGTDGQTFLLNVEIWEQTHLPSGLSVNNVFWSPDSSRLVFQGYDGDASRIYLAEGDGNNAQVVAEEGNYNGLPNWSSDGQYIYFSSSRNNVDIYRMNADGSNVINVSESQNPNENIFLVTADPDEKIEVPSPECFISSGESPRLRGGPGTNYDVVGNLASGEQEVDGQVTDTNAYVWWHLSSGEWVRSDLVEESAYCNLILTLETP